ncbi:MAG: glycosyltransferase family 9 protein [bacterium]
MLLMSLRIKIAKWLDEYVGRVLIVLVRGLRLRKRGANQQASRARILVIKFWGMGSIILLEPALRSLRERFPHARIDFLTLAQNQDVFALLPHIDHVYVLEFGNDVRFIMTTFSVLARLRLVNYDLIFDAEFFANFSALLARVAAPKTLVGFSRPLARKRELLDLAVPFHDEEHATQNFLRLILAAPSTQESGAGFSSLYKVSPRLRLAAPEHRRFVDTYVVINVNASPLALERRWPRENFVQLARWLLREYEIELALIGNAAEREYTQHVAGAIDAPDRVRNRAGALNLRELAALMHDASLVISNDSGPLHLAAALHRPVVGFYGPETPKRFGPLNDEQLIFYLGLPCSPCMSVHNAKTVNCTNHRRCMLQLSVAMVVPRLRRFIDENGLLPKRVAQGQMIEVAD